MIETSLHKTSCDCEENVFGTKVGSVGPLGVKISPAAKHAAEAIDSDIDIFIKENHTWLIFII